MLAFNHLSDLIVEDTPIQKVDVSPWLSDDYEIHIKRDDLTHEHVSGNKWRKLKYNLLHVIDHHAGIISFGGAFSNHIYALSYACFVLKIPLILYVRGDKIDPHNPTLAFCIKHGAKIMMIDRSRYRDRNDAAFISEVQQRNPNYFIIPEGGTNAYSEAGTRELAKQIKFYETNFDGVSISAGTGGTASGLINEGVGAPITVFSSLKGNFLQKDIDERLKSDAQSWCLNTDYHFGGYARWNTELIEFIRSWYKHTQIAVEPIYTAKHFYGLLDLCGKGELRPGKYLMIHSGGLQGLAGFNYLNDGLLSFVK